jgi:hypothetical protein
MNLFCFDAIQTYLKLKTQPKQLLGYLHLAFTLPIAVLIAAVNWLIEQASG